MSAAAFRATIHGLKTVPTRKVCQLTVEFPIEQLPHVAKIAEHGAWVGIARLQETPAQQEQPAEPVKDRRKFNEMPYPQQAALRCNDPVFRAFLRETCNYEPITADEAAEAVRELCDVASRSDIKPGTKAETRWLWIESSFDAWKLKERVGV